MDCTTSSNLAFLKSVDDTLTILEELMMPEQYERCHSSRGNGIGEEARSGEDTGKGR